MIKNILFWMIILHLCAGSAGVEAQVFGDRIDLGQIEHGPITEASGIVASRQNPGVLWTHNDSGGRNVLFAFDSTGRHLGEYHIAGIQNRDWEDLSLGQDPTDGRYYLFVGEIGDNSRRYDKKYIYRVPEPAVNANQAPVDTVLYEVARLVFRYPDGNKNAETLMFDQLTGDIYVVSKETPSRLYRAPFPQKFYPMPTTHVDTLQLMLTLNFSKAVSGDISPSGLEILVKLYSKIYYWARQPDEPLWQTLAGSPLRLPYVKEPQGEAVCWDARGQGYYTLSEEANNRPAHLYYYPRLDAGSAVADRGDWPADFRLQQNYPNPFNAATTIVYSLSAAQFVRLSVFDVQGKEVQILVHAFQPPGTYSYTFRAEGLASGLYFCQLKTERDNTKIMKMLYVK